MMNILPSLRAVSLGWLPIGLAALAISGIFSIILAVAWHPSVKSVTLFATLFQRSLIAHVNLSITVWFVCCAFMLMDYHQAGRTLRLAYVNAASQWLMIATIALMTAASLHPASVPILCNYIPMLQHPLFTLSLGCLCASIVLKLLEYTLCDAARVRGNALAWHNRVMALTLLVSLACAVASATVVKQEIDFVADPLIYGEMLFWGAGHVLQYAWVQLMLIAWVVMLQVTLKDIAFGQGLRWIFYCNIIAVATAPIPYALYSVTSGDFREMFTWLMAWMSGISPILFMGYYGVMRLRESKRLLPPYREMVGACLWWSWILFALGGAFAVMIDGINVKIPAHYHGSLLGVTVALMGLVYALLHAHGYDATRCKTLGWWQPTLLGIGQVMHIVGLFWSGGYGVQRKSPQQEGAAMELADLALRVQSSGGGIAIIGGLLFLVVCYKMWRGRNKRIATQK